MAPRVSRETAAQSPQEPATRDRAPGSDVVDAPDEDRPQAAALGDLELLEQLGDGVTFYLYRIGLDGHKVARGFENVPAFTMKFTGRFDLDEVAKQVGGGSFEVIARTGTSIVAKRRISIEGTPRQVRYEPPAPAPPPPAPAPSADLSRLEQQLADLRTELRGLRAPAATPSLEELLRITERLQRPSAPAPSLEGMISIVEMIDRQAERMAERTGSERNPLAAVLKDAVPEVLRLLGARAGGAPVPAAAGSAQPSPAAAEPNVLVAMLARAIAYGRDPESVADATEEILSDVEVAQLRGADPEQVIAHLHSVASAHPEILSESGIAWVRSWHAALRTPPATS